MLSLKLCNDRTEVDMDHLAQAFLISRTELEDCLQLGTISYWYELGASDDDTPQMVFRSNEMGRRVALDRVGNIVSGWDEGSTRKAGVENRMNGSTDLLPTEASTESRPPRPSGADSVEADRLVA